jgi:hypothetical protein
MQFPAIPQATSAFDERLIKILARDDRTRPQDALDLRQLISGADADDLALALDAARLIEARGYNRGRDLVSGLQVTWAEFRDDRG